MSECHDSGNGAAVIHFEDSSESSSEADIPVVEDGATTHGIEDSLPIPNGLDPTPAEGTAGASSEQ